MPRAFFNGASEHGRLFVTEAARQLLVLAASLGACLAASETQADVSAVCAGHERAWKAALAKNNPDDMKRVRGRVQDFKGACPDLVRRMNNWKPAPNAASRPPASPTIEKASSNGATRPLLKPTADLGDHWKSRYGSTCYANNIFENKSENAVMRVDVEEQKASIIVEINAKHYGKGFRSYNQSLNNMCTFYNAPNLLIRLGVRERNIKYAYSDGCTCKDDICEQHGNFGYFVTPVTTQVPLKSVTQLSSLTITVLDGPQAGERLSFGLNNLTSAIQSCNSN
jgi:hypothetical protein